MASTYSPLLRFELIAAGEQAGLWGNTTNSNLGTLIEQAIAGVTTVTLPNTTDYTLSTLNGTSDEARAAVLVFNGTPGGTTNVVVPALQKTYTVRNTTPSTLVIKTSAQVGGVSVAPGAATLVHCDGVNVYSSVDKLYYTQMNFLSQSGGPLFVPQYDSIGNLGMFGTLQGTWNSGGGGYSLPINDVNAFASVKPVFAYEFGIGSMFTQQWTGAGQSGVGHVVNGKWTGGAGGSMKLINSGGSTLFMQGDFLYWWGSTTNTSGTAGGTANYRWQMHLDCTQGNLITRLSFGVSDRKYKTDLVAITGAMAKLRTLTGYTYKRLDMGPDAVLPRSTGLIAQDLQKVLPEAVVDVGDGTLAVAYGNLAGILVNALKELDARITSIEARLKAAKIK